ncbi:MAG TPA: DEAD/DEAH box helicase [Syntrophomonadaceae bacterium]|nr:DEAD/DEAH box helicase [Syntrophomonadaceae bacterium]
MATFEELQVAPIIIQALTNMGFEEATPIQEKALPLALAGRDLIGRAQTGTGKTAAFGIPLVDRCLPDEDQIQGIVITPTRELAMQVAEELNRIGQTKNIRSLPIYGGQEIDRQINALRKRPHIIVGTPGRLMDHMRRRTIRLQRIKMVVLDEADEMLNMGFLEDIEDILKQMPAQRQNLLFSATMPGHIQTLARQFMNSPEIIHIDPKDVTVSGTEQYYIETAERQKLDVLCRLLDIQNPGLAIVFARTKRRVDEIGQLLGERGYSAQGIHGDLSQSSRDAIMRRFRAGEIDILVATDVAARGLDISGVTHIYNFDIPQDPEGYVHRIGRTGRAGETGIAITLVTPRELSHLNYIEGIIKHRIIRKPAPSLSEAFAGLQRIAVDNLIQVMDHEDTQQYKSLAESLLDDYDSIALISAALKILTREPAQHPLHELTEAPPIKIKSPPRAPSPQRRDGRRPFSSKKRPIPGGPHTRNR